MIPRCLTIATSDSGGGAGIQADLKAFARLGCHGMSAVVALTAQSTTEVRAVHEAPPDFIRDQLEVLFDDIGVDAAKTGMLFSATTIETVADFLGGHRAPLVVDPVMVAASGAKLLQDDAVSVLVERLFPLATVVTPNLHEACVLAGVPYSEHANREELAEAIHGLGACAVVVTGGHGSEAVDWLFDGERHVPIAVERYGSQATHGAGCTHSAALTAFLAHGATLEEAARGAANVASEAVRSGLQEIGSGSGPVDVFGLGTVEALSELGEFGLLAELERRGLVSGQDAEGAVLEGGLVVTQDVLVEGVHFRSEWTSWRDLGYKAAAVNLSDLAAMAAEPVGLLVGLAAALETGEATILELYEGIAEAGVPVLGGDTTAAGEFSISVTAVGEASVFPAGRGLDRGAVLVVTGPLGGAAAGLYALEHGLEGFDELVRRHRRPPFRLEEGRRLGPAAHALIDLSDGILSDAARIAGRSRCRLAIDVESVPRASRIEEVADLPFWTMGEDYELLAAVAPEDAAALGLTVVGRVEEGVGVEPDLPAGWDAFRR